MKWINEYEFRFNGQMYDIIDKEEKGDSIYLYCIDDSIESELYSILDKFIENDTEDTDEQYGINNFLSHFYLLSEFNISFQNHQTNNLYNEILIGNVLEGEYLINTPPPRA